MREVSLDESFVASEAATLRACIATILEAPLEVVPEPAIDQGGIGWRTVRWLGGRGLGLVPVADAASFSWAGPWIGWVRSPAGRRAVVMYGVPSGVTWDPARVGELGDGQPEAGFVLAALDIALALPAAAQAPTTTGSVEGIYVAAEAGASAQAVDAVRALPDRGLEGDRHVTGKGTFPSGLPGSALTLVQSEVCESFEPPLSPDEHRRNIVTSGIDLNSLVGRLSHEPDSASLHHDMWTEVPSDIHMLCQLAAKSGSCDSLWATVFSSARSDAGACDCASRAPSFRATQRGRCYGRLSTVADSAPTSSRRACCEWATTSEPSDPIPSRRKTVRRSPSGSARSWSAVRWSQASSRSRSVIPPRTLPASSGAPASRTARASPWRSRRRVARSSSSRRPPR